MDNGQYRADTLVTCTNGCIPVITGCGSLAATFDFLHVDRVADFNILIYVTEGTIYVTEDDTDHEIRPGEVFFLKAGLHHYGKQLIRKGTRWHYMHFRLPDQSFNSTDPYLLSAPLPKKLKIAPDGKLHHLITSYTQKYENWVVPPDWRSGAEFYEILVSVLEHGAHMPVMSKKSTVISQIRNYLAEHFKDAYSAAALEQTFFMDYKYMARLFRSETGMTMQEYHNSIKIEEANRLLRNSMMSVSEIADAVGYKDPLYFSRYYRRITGMSPSGYRKQVIQV